MSHYYLIKRQNAERTPISDYLSLIRINATPKKTTPKNAYNRFIIKSNKTPLLLKEFKLFFDWRTFKVLKGGIY